MAVWRLLYAGLVSGDLLGELAFLSASHHDTLNGEGSWSATIPFDDPDLVQVPDGAGGLMTVDRSTALDFTGLGCGRTVVYFERDGVILGQGIVWGIDLDYAAGTMNLSGAGFASYYNHRLLFASNWVAADQALIARSLIDASNAGGALDAIADTVTTGVLRDRQFFYFESKPALEAVDQLANVENGFDYRFRAHRESGAIVRRMHIDYPATGRQTDIVFEVGVNAAILGYSEDGGDLANNIRALGAGEGADKLIRTAGAPPLAETPILDASISHIDVTVAATLDDYARRRLQRGVQPMRRITLTMVPDTVPALGSFDVGDRVYVRARKGWLNVADVFRVVEIAIGIDQGGETVTLTMAGIEAFET